MLNGVSLTGLDYLAIALVVGIVLTCGIAAIIELFGKKR